MQQQVEVLPVWAYLVIVILPILTGYFTLRVKNRFSLDFKNLEAATALKVEESKRAAAEAENQATQAKSYSESIKSLTKTLESTLDERRDNTQATRDQTQRLGDLIDALNKRDLGFADMHRQQMDGIKALMEKSDALPTRISEDVAKLLTNHQGDIIEQFRVIAETIANVATGLDTMQRAVEAQTNAQNSTADQIQKYGDSLRDQIVGLADKLDDNFKQYLLTVKTEGVAA